MPMTKVVDLHNQWRGFTAERGRAKRAVAEKIEENNARIAELREENIRLETEFDNEWKNKKEQLKVARDEAVMDLLASGRSAQSILRELGSNNTVWIYDLRDKVMTAKGIPVPSNVNTLTHAKPAEEPESAPIQILPDVKWLHHNHQGVVGWLVSEDQNYVKRWGQNGTDFEGQWFICDRQHNFIAGNLELFGVTPRTEVTKRTKLLLSLLDGSYEGKIREADNPFTS